jgi:hypothetical protein
MSLSVHACTQVLNATAHIAHYSLLSIEKGDMLGFLAMRMQRTANHIHADDE